MSIPRTLMIKGMKIQEHFLRSLHRGRQGNIEPVEQFVRELVKELARVSPTEYIEPVCAGDPRYYLVVHPLNVALYSLLFGLRLQEDEADLFDIGMGALLHDVGKMNTPETLQWKQHSNDEYEHKTLAEHSAHGAHWISSSYLVSDNVLRIINDHHERFDGGGYPRALRGNELRHEVNIVSICNYYDYLTTTLPGKPGLAPREAFFMIHGQSEKRFNPKVVGAFMNHLGPHLMREPLFRKTMLVMLDSREIARVTKIDRFGDTEPEILVLTNALGKKLPRPIPVNLKKDPTRRIVKLLRVS